MCNFTPLEKLLWQRDFLIFDFLIWDCLLFWLFIYEKYARYNNKIIGLFMFLRPRYSLFLHVFFIIPFFLYLQFHYLSLFKIIPEYQDKVKKKYWKVMFSSSSSSLVVFNMIIRCFMFIFDLPLSSLLFLLYFLTRVSAKNRWSEEIQIRNSRFSFLFNFIRIYQLTNRQCAYR